MTGKVWETLKADRERLKAESAAADYWHDKMHEGHSRAECPEFKLQQIDKQVVS